MGIRPCILIARCRSGLEAKPLPVIDDGRVAAAGSERTATAAIAGAVGAVPGAPSATVVAARVVRGGDPSARTRAAPKRPVVAFRDAEEVTKWPVRPSAPATRRAPAKVAQTAVL